MMGLDTIACCSSAAPSCSSTPSSGSAPDASPDNTMDYRNDDEDNGNTYGGATKNPDPSPTVDRGGGATTGTAGMGTTNG